jgi:hypothetical protein
MALLLCGAMAFCAPIPIGIKNSNPGNISGKNLKFWRKLGATGHDPWGHLIFATDADGLRAIKFVLAGYRAKKINTVRKIARRWTGHPLDLSRHSYVAAIAQSVGAALDEPLDLADPCIVSALARGIILGECGRRSYPSRLWMQIFGDFCR